VVRIHAGKFGVDKVLIDLCKLALENLAQWRGNEEIPQSFLNALFANNQTLKSRYEVETQRAGFLRDLHAFFKLVEQSRSGSETSSPEADQSQLGKLEQRLLEMANGYGIDLASTDMTNLDDTKTTTLLKPIQTDLLDLFDLVHGEQKQRGDFSPESFWESLLTLVAEYTEGFNNDEIRAIFQEASLEHHLDGQLITPRYIGLKIGIIRKRRDERQVVHLTTQRGRR
jgi:hypothetical protein